MKTIKLDINKIYNKSNFNGYIIELNDEPLLYLRNKLKIVAKYLFSNLSEKVKYNFISQKIQDYKEKLITIHKTVKEDISKLITKKAGKLDIGGNIVLKSAAKTIKYSNILIAVYDTGEFVDMAGRFGNLYKSNAKIAEISAISASIQNMIFFPFHNLMNLLKSSPEIPKSL